MKMRVRTLPLLALVAVLGLTSCTINLGGASPTEAPKKQSEKPAAADPTTAPESASDPEPAPAAGKTPAWLVNPVNVGQKIATTDARDWVITVYQVGTGKMDRDSSEVDPDTHKSLLPAGTEVVYLNFVYTNKTSKTIMPVSIEAPRIAEPGWRFLGGQPGVVTPDLYREQGLDPDVYNYKLMKKFPGKDSTMYDVGAGASVSVPASIAYKAGGTYQASLTFASQDAKGAFLEDFDDVKFDFTVK